MTYYEDKKIVSVEDSENGDKRLTVEFSETPESTPETESFDVKSWEYEVNSSDNPIDASSARNNRAVYIVDRMYDLFKDLDVHVDEISFIMQKFVSKIQGVESRAILNSYGKQNPSDVRISDWENKL